MKIKPIRKFPLLALSLTRGTLQSFCRSTGMTLYRFFKPTEGNSQLNSAPVRDADKAVELHVNTKFSSCRGGYAKFTPKQQANVARYACMHSSLMEASHTLQHTW